MKERILATSILAADFTNLGSEIEKAVSAGAKYMHIDVMDGIFVPYISFGMPVIESIRKVTDVVFDTHLMISKPERYLKYFKEIGCDSITVHIEALEDPEKVLTEIHALGAKAGLSVNPETLIETVFPYLDMVDMVLVMTVNPGFGGQKYIHDCTAKVKAVAEELKRLGLEDKVDIEVDGGLGENTVDEALEAGANVIVAGTAIFKGDIETNVKGLMKHF